MLNKQCQWINTVVCVTVIVTELRASNALWLTKRFSKKHSHMFIEVYTNTHSGVCNSEFD